MREIALTQGYVAIVDDADFDRVSDRRWYAQEFKRTDGTVRVYAMSSVSRNRKIRMHRFVIGEDVSIVDHIDGNGLNNVRSNLRPATKSQNAVNSRARASSSRFRGVHWHSKHRKWTSSVRGLDGRIHLGMFNSEEDAAHAYDRAARVAYGEFARLNFPDAASDDRVGKEG